MVRVRFPFENHSSLMRTPCNSVQQAARELSFAVPTSIQTSLRWVTKAEARARALTPNELAVFSANSNRGTLLVSYTDDTHVIIDLAQIRHCEFEGKNVLFQREVSPEADFALQHSTFQDCRIESGARVLRTARVRRTILLANSSVEACGLVSGPRGISTAFGNGLELSPGLGTGERSVRVVAESTLEHIARVSLDQFRCAPEELEEYNARVDDYVQQCHSEFSIINEFAEVRNCGELVCVFVGPRCVVSSGSAVRHATLMRECVIELNSVLDVALLQPKVSASSQAIINQSLCLQQSSVALQGKLLESVLGPKAQLAEGEISSSLVGPLVGFHHQAMLIAAFWPRGRGNVAYGANCGSNHTSRAADQSLWPGEGVFFGLGCCIKLPLNLTEAAHSIVATGVNFGPGRLAFPFSLVTAGGAGAGAGGRCQVAPGWGIESNAYALERNEMKMQSRAPAGYSAEVFSVDNARQVLRARRVLAKAILLPDVDVFEEDAATGMHLAGGYVARRDVEKGVRGYTRFLRLFALRGASKHGFAEVPAQINEEEDNDEEEIDYASTGLAAAENEAGEEEARRRDQVAWFLQRVFQADQVGKSCLALLHEMEVDFAKSVLQSKERDTARGAQVLPRGRYAEALPLERDEVVLHAQARAQAVAAAAGVAGVY